MGTSTSSNKNSNNSSLQNQENLHDETHSIETVQDSSSEQVTVEDSDTSIADACIQQTEQESIIIKGQLNAIEHPISAQLNDLKRRTRRISNPIQKNTKKSKLDRPRWWNQTYIIYLVLRRYKEPISRRELIPQVLELEEQLAKEKQLPRLFTGKTPQNTVSGRLTENNSKYYIKTVQNGKQFFQLAFQPGNFQAALDQYKKWTKDLIECDWPLFFGDPELYSRKKILASVKQESILLNNELIDGEFGENVLFGSLENISLGLDESTTKNNQIELDTDNQVKEQVQIELDTDNQIKQKIQITLDTNNQADQESKIEFETQSECEKVKDSTNNSEFNSPKPFIPTSMDQVLEIKDSSILNSGLGVFALIDIPKWTFLGFYFGVGYSEDEFDQFKEAKGVASVYAHRYRNTVLDATNEDGVLYSQACDDLYCPFHYINEDVKRTNVAFIEGNQCNQIICMSLKKIKKGDELFVHYGKELERPWLQKK